MLALEATIQMTHDREHLRLQARAFCARSLEPTRALVIGVPLCWPEAQSRGFEHAIVLETVAALRLDQQALLPQGREESERGDRVRPEGSRQAFRVELARQAARCQQRRARLGSQ